jgi:hypothetical protein
MEKFYSLLLTFCLEVAMILHDSILINTTPDRIFEFFEHMDENYLRWHPDHLLFRWEKGRGLSEGVEFYFEERIGGQLLKKRVRFTHIEPNRHIEFAVTNPLIRLIMPRLLFAIEPQGEQSRFIAEIHIRTGPIGARLNAREFNAVRQHMKEEGENLKKLLEGQEQEES